MVLIDHADQLLCTPMCETHFKHSASDRGVDTLATHLFFARVEALCVQVLHKSP